MSYPNQQNLPAGAIPVYPVIGGAAVGPTNPVPVTGITPLGGGIVWGNPQAVVLTGASQNLVAANATRKAIRIINRIGNAQISYNLGGGAVTLIGGDQMNGGQKDWYTGAECPVGIITVIGTAAQTVTVIEGT